MGFDRRICEIAGYRLSLTHSGDCKPPLNVNDFDLRPEMQSAPEAHKTPTEALFVVVRSLMVDRLLDFMAQPAGTSEAARLRADALITDFERHLDDTFFRFCNPENPLHFMTMWSVQGALCKFRLMMRYSLPSTSAQSESDKQTLRDLAFADAINALEADTKLSSSPQIRGFNWYLNMYFPFPAYIHLVQELKERPIGEHADQAWLKMSENFAARIEDMDCTENGVVRTFARRILQIWDMREAAILAKPGAPPSIETPSMVLRFRQILAQGSSTSSNATPSAAAVEAAKGGAMLGASTSDQINPSGLPTPSSFDAGAIQYSSVSTDAFPAVFPDSGMDFNGMGSMQWNVNFWNQMNAPTWW
jgi:hypothetical protein